MKDRPNILWICTDQQRPDTIHALGNDKINTPNLDRLVRTGTTFSNAYAQNPLCQPSRGSFLTGRYPRTNGIRQNGQEPWPDHEILVTKRLADFGYTCGLVGKLHISSAAEKVEQRTDDGYSTFCWSHHSYLDKAWHGHHDYEDWLLAKGVNPEELQEKHDREIRGVCGGVPEEYHQSTWLAERSMEFIDKTEGPWCLSLNPYDPHHSFDPPYDYLKRYNPDDMPDPAYVEGEREEKPFPHQVDARGAYGGSVAYLCHDEMTPHERRNVTAAYYAMIELLDAQVGRIIDHLEETGQRENTVIIFQSDHGELLGDHGIYLKGPYFYDCSVKVPLIMSCPGLIPEDVRKDALVELVDIVPTLCELSGMEVPAAVQGKSFAGLLKGEAKADHHRDDVYCEYMNSSWTYDGVPAVATMVYDGRYKIVCYHGVDTGELYDLESDPGEHRNLWSAPEHVELKQRMMKLCLDRIAFTMDPMPPRVHGF